MVLEKTVSLRVKSGTLTQNAHLVYLAIASSGGVNGYERTLDLGI